MEISLSFTVQFTVMMEELLLFSQWKTPCLKSIYHGYGTYSPEEIPVFGVVPTGISCLQSSEVIKYILGIGQLLAGRLLIYDGLSEALRPEGLGLRGTCRSRIR